MRRARSLVSTLLLVSVTAACGGDDDTDDDGADGGGAADAAPTGDALVDTPDSITTLFVLNSSAFSDEGAIPVQHTCEGDNISPPMTWSGGPVAQGYALVLTDLDFAGGTVHSVLWDIPGDVTSLPEDVERVAEPAEPPGSKQALSLDGATVGYLGPCPPKQHTYEFMLYALGENPLSGVTLDSTRDEVVEVLADQALLTTRLTGTFTPTPKR